MTSETQRQPLPVYLIHWNAPDWVKSATDSILSSDMPVAVTVVDNGPSEASAALRLSERVRVLQAGSNLGYAGGANVALRDWLNGSSDWCVVGAHDLHVRPSDLRKMVEAGERAPSFGILGPGTTEHGGRPYWAGSHLGELEGIEKRTSMSGTCLLLQRRCISEIGLFDTQFGSYGEDDDLCARAGKSGWSVGRVPDTYAHGLGNQAEDRNHRIAKNRVLLAVKSSGSRVAGLKVLLFYARSIATSTIRLVLDWENQLEYRAKISERWYGIRHGAPFLWKRMLPPPAAP